MEVKLSYEPSCTSVGRSVDLSVGLSVLIFYKGREVTLPCSYCSTCFVHGTYYNIDIELRLYNNSSQSAVLIIQSLYRVDVILVKPEVGGEALVEGSHHRLAVLRVQQTLGDKGDYEVAVGFILQI